MDASFRGLSVFVTLDGCIVMKVGTVVRYIVFIRYVGGIDDAAVVEDGAAIPQSCGGLNAAVDIASPWPADR